MSADNWARCPHCVQVAENAFAAQSACVDLAYGKVPVGEFDVLRAKLAGRREFLDKENTHRTFCENYEFSGAEEGVVHVYYKGECTKCGIALKIDQDYNIPGLT